MADFTSLVPMLFLEGLGYSGRKSEKSNVDHISNHMQLTETIELYKHQERLISISIIFIPADLENTPWEQFQSYFSLCSSLNILLVHIN